MAGKGSGSEAEVPAFILLSSEPSDPVSQLSTGVVFISSAVPQGFPGFQSFSLSFLQ